jgi:hypothetical protein
VLPALEVELDCLADTRTFLETLDDKAWNASSRRRAECTAVTRAAA